VPQLVVPIRVPPTSHVVCRSEDTSVSSLWTPYGEHEPEPAGEQGPGATAPPPAGGTPPGGDDDEAEVRAAVARLAATPVADIVANHAIGLWQLAVLHLGLGGDVVPDVAQAAVALDAMAALVDGLGDRLGEHAGPLRDALAQLRLAYVQVADAVAERPAQPPAD
jgi:hypothetical protein